MANISQIYHNGVLYGLEDKTARKLSPLNIKSFGAKGDGMTDDTEAIILAAQCGAPVFFPCGTYLLSRQIDVSKNICFYGEGECSLIKLIPADQSRTEENDDGVTVYTCNMFFSDENTPAKLELRNLSLDASKADYSNDVLNNGSSKNDITHCIYLNYPTSVKLSGVSLKNSTADGALIICGNATKVNIENCHFDSCGFSNNAANGLTIEGGNSVSVSNCSFDKNSGNGLSVSTVNSYYSNVKASDNGYDGIFICNGARDNAFSGVHCCKNRSGIFIKSDNDLSHIDYGRLEQPTHNTFCNTVCENNVYGIMLGASKDTVLNGFCSRDYYFYAICCNCEITGHLYNESISATIGYGYDFTGGDITGFTVGVYNKLICEYAPRKAYKTYSATSGIIDTTTGSFISGNGITTDYIPLLSRNILLSSPAENIYVCAYGKDKKLLGEYFNGSSFVLVQSGADFNFAENVRYIRCFAIGSSRGTFSIEYTFENTSPIDNGENLLDIVNGKAFSPAIELSATGEDVLISDSASAKIKGLTLYGKSVQEGTPTPDVPIEVESAGDSGSVDLELYGKNLTGKASSLSTYLSIVDGVYTANNTSATNQYVTLMSVTLPKGAYAFSSTINNTGIFVYVVINGEYRYVVREDQKSILFNLTDKTTISLVALLHPNANGTFTLQLEPNTVSSYEVPKYQVLSHSTPNGLRGIPVSSGGNYTDENGQQWICDEVDFARGVYIQRVGVLDLNGTENFAKAWSEVDGVYRMSKSDFPAADSSIQVFTGYCSHYQPSTHSEIYSMSVNNAISHVYGLNAIIIRDANFSSVEDFKTYLAEQYSNGTPVKVYYVIKNEIKNSLSPMEIHKFNSAQMNYPVTTVFNQNNCFMKIDYCADTKLYIDRKITELMHSQNSV